jgi:PEP-CTERM motif-containing protein
VRFWCRFVCLLTVAGSASAGVIFTDSFDGGPSSLWGNDWGDWSATGGIYDASAGAAVPNAHSLLPYSLTDFSGTVEITTEGEGGIWLRAANAPGTTMGVTGVLLVILPLAGELYWNVVSDGAGYGAPVNSASITAGPHTVTVTATGDQYAAFLDGADIPVTTLTDDTFNSGQTGLYDRTPLGFDNYSLSAPGSVPEPGAVALLLAGVAALTMAKRRRG